METKQDKEEWKKEKGQRKREDRRRVAGRKEEIEIGRKMKEKSKAMKKGRGFDEALRRKRKQKEVGIDRETGRQIVKEEKEEEGIER